MLSAPVCCFARSSCPSADVKQFVLFGHDAKKKLQRSEHAIGLGTYCTATFSSVVQSCLILCHAVSCTVVLYRSVVCVLDVILTQTRGAAMASP